MRRDPPSALELRSSQVTRWLLQQRTIDVNQKDAQDCTLLLCACEEGSAETVSLLLEHPDVRRPRIKHGSFACRSRPVPCRLLR